MLLKCGQKDNTKYTFGVKKSEDGEPSSKICEKCKNTNTIESKFCCQCGEKFE